MSNILNLDLSKIGFNFYLSSSLRMKDNDNDNDIESVIFTALQESEKNHDTKLLSLILSWSHIYATYLIPEKLRKIQERAYGGKKSLYFNIFCIYLFEELKIHKFKKLINAKLTGYLTTESKDILAIQIKGEENFCLKYNIHVPKGILRIRTSDILPIEKLIKKNLQMRNRLLIGANWRADIVTEIQKGLENPYRIAKKLGCSYEPANRIFKDYSYLKKVSH